MGMKTSRPDASHIVRNGRHSLHGLSSETIYDCLVRLGRHIAIPFDELSNDFIVHFVDCIPDQWAHRGHPEDGERRGHHYLEVSLLREAVNVTSWLPMAHNDNKPLMTGLKSDKSKCASSTTTK